MKVRQTTPASSSITTSNRFSPLSNTEENDEDTSTVSTKSQSPNQSLNPILLPMKFKTPIIIPYYGESLPKMNDRFKKICRKAFSIKHLGDRVKVFTNNLEDHKHLLEFLKSNKINHHTHAIKDDKPRIAVLKGLPADVELHEILDEVKSSIPNAFDCMKMHNCNPKYPFFLIKFSPLTTFQEVTKISHIFNTRIYWEKFHPKSKATQCYNCQAYGHGARNCGFPPKCFKCGSNHRTSDCTKPKEESPKCANCQGDHLSNNRKCTAYKTYIDKIEKLKNKSKPSLRQGTLDTDRRPPDPGDLSLFPALPTDYSQPRWGPRGGGYPAPVLTPALQPGLPPVQRTEDLTGTERRRVSGEHATGIGDLQELIELMKELQLICDLKSLIEKVKKLIPKLREAKTDLERIQACLDLANLDD
ncbi:hypothetical protein M8J76_010043 [Diaphorina citri]|nr:hypothetical protein M8J76_010043 [Diaphorina citri]